MKEKAIPLVDFTWKCPPFITRRTDQTFRFCHVTSKEIETLLRKIKRKKATGTDNLPANLLKYSSKAIAEPLTFIINLSLGTGVVPNDWKVARVLPLYKSGSRSSLDNYRPISILPVISKIAEKVVHSQLIHFLELNNLLSNSQFGFRQNRSTEMATTIFTDDIRQSVDKGNLVGAVFIDLRKAFDTISHSLLLSKLQSYGITGTELSWFTNYLFNRHCIVQFDSCISNSNPLTSGVPQGSILGPLLFIVFFNDIVDVIKHAKLLKYADDTVVYVASKDVSTINNLLTEDLRLLADWFDQNELLINLKKGKTECLLFGTRQKLAKRKDSFNVKYKDNDVVETESYKYLGVDLTSNLTLSSYFDRCYKKATSRLRLLQKLRNLLTITSAKAIYRSMIVPCLVYCAILNLNLTTTQIYKLNSIQRRASEITYVNTRINAESLPSY